MQQTVAQPLTQQGQLCVLRLSAIGDVCHAIAMITHIRQARPDIHITWVIGKVEYQLVKNLPEITFVVFDKQKGKQAFREVKSALQNTTFDALFVMQVAFRANWLSRQIKARQRIGFDWARSKELHWLFTNKRIKAQQHSHVLEGFLGFSEAIGIALPANPSWHYPIPDEAQTWFNQPNSPTAAFKDKPYAVINPSASKAERNWLPERYGEVATYILQKGMAVVITGGPAGAEKQLAEAVSSHVPPNLQANLHNLVGLTRLPELAVLLKNASLVVAPDTGPAHIAAMFNTPVIGLYAHSNPRRTGPYQNSGETISVYDNCITEQTGKSWQDLPWGKRAKGALLMEKIKTENVINAVKSLLFKLNL